MNEGILEGAGKFQQYENLVESGKSLDAYKMYRNNELHTRRPAYMLSHGEAGEYKDQDASAKNEAMTSRLVDKAAALWDWNKGNSWGQSLSVLSDALHQAADRGSHGEGNAFTGHDVRILRNKYSWERDGQKLFMAKSGGIAPSQWEPDNMAINKKGAVLAVGFVQGALTKFKKEVKAKQEDPSKEPKIKLATRIPAKRLLRVLTGKQALVGTSGFGRHFAGETGLGKRGGLGKLKKILKEGKVSMGEAYEAAKASPEVKQALDEGFRTGLLKEGMTFYEVGTRLFTGEEKKLFNRQKRTHEWLFNSWKRQKKTYARIKNLYKARYLSIIRHYEGREKEIVSSALKAAYHAVFKRPPWDPF
jgi:hypothetical protein